MGVLRGPADRERPARHPPRVGPIVQGPLSPLPHDARPARRPQGRMGLPRPARRARGREGARVLGQAADRGVRHRGVQRSAAGSRSTATSTTSPGSPSRIGMWIDIADAYWTLSNDYIESVWWLFHEMWDRGLIYEGFKVVPYCGRCGTALSSHEVAPGIPRRHRTVGVRPVPRRRRRLRPARLDDHAVDAGVERRRRRRARRRVRPGARARAGATSWSRRRASRPCSATASRSSGPSRSPTSSAATTSGRSTSCRSTRRRAGWSADDFVTIDDGSGIVHLAPAFGEIDREVGEREGLPILNPVGPDARFDAAVPALQPARS